MAFLKVKLFFLILFSFNCQWVLMCLVIKKVQERQGKKKKKIRINLPRIWKTWTWSVMLWEEHKEDEHVLPKNNERSKKNLI